MRALRRMNVHVSPAVVRRVQREAGKKARGKIAAIDPITRQYFLGETEIDAARAGRARLQDPRRLFYFIRIGFDVFGYLRGKWRPA